MALKEIVDEFFISIGLDTKKLEGGLDKAVTNTKNTLKNLATGIVAPALAGLATGAFINELTNEISAVDRLSQSLGVNIESLQAWQGAAERAGVAGEEIGELFADLNDWMLDSAVNESGALHDFVEQGLLPAVRDAEGAMKGTEEYALELAEAFKQMGTQMASGMGRQIGISQAAMVAFLQQGRGTIEQELQRVKELGVYTEKDAKAVKEFKIATDELVRIGKSMMLPLFRIALPLLKGLAEGLTYLSKHAWALVPAIVGIGTAITVSLIPAGTTFIGLLKALQIQFLKFAYNPWTWVIAGLVAVGLLLEDFVVWLDGGESALGDFWQSGADIFNRFAEDAKETLAHVEQFVSDFAEFLKGVWEPVGDGLSMLKQWFTETFDAIEAKATEWWNYISGIITKAKEFLGLGDTAVEAGKDRWQGYLDGTNEPPTSPPPKEAWQGYLLGAPGAAAQAISPADIHNATTNTRNTSLDSKTTVNIYGNPDRETVNNGTAAANEINGYNISQAVSSQAGI